MSVEERKHDIAEDESFNSRTNQKGNKLREPINQLTLSRK